VVTIKELTREEYWLPGNSSCPGCPAALGLRMLGKALEGKFVLVVPASCTTVIQGIYPATPSRVPLLNIAFAASASAASGLRAALRIRGLKVPHGVPYVATASIAYPLDFVEKVRKAASKSGFRYIHLHAPCPVGWRFPPSKTVEVGRLAVETGMWILYEIENGVLRLTGRSRVLLDPSKRKPIEEYLRAQGRFSHLDERDVEELKRYVEARWRELKKLLEERGGCLR